LYNYIARKKAGQTVTSPSLPDHIQASIDKAGDELIANAGNSIVVAGANDVHTQTMVNAINALLNNYGNTIDIDNYDTTKQGRDEQVEQLVREMNNGAVSALFIYGLNPVYSLPNGQAFASALEKVKLTVSFSDRADETASRVKYICPDHHYLESWNDFQPRRGKYSLSQPTISPLFQTRQAQDSLLNWAGINTTYYAYVRNNWENTLFGQQNTYVKFDSFWNNALHDGVFQTASLAKSEVSFAGDITNAAQKLTTVTGSDLELVLYTKTSMGDGSQANNPWLQELPDPITRISWDNYITMNPNQMSGPNYGFSLLARGDDQADMAEVIVNDTRIELPVVPMPGQAIGTIGIALGYGRTMAGKAGNDKGGNAFALIGFAQGNYQYNVLNASINKLAGKTYPIASVQQHHTLMGREDGILRETILSEYLKDPRSGNRVNMLATHAGPKQVKKVDLWRDHPVNIAGHRWAMTIDLNTCFGCGSCVTACHSENNVPVVGKDEVRRGRDMHWLRIDRYFGSAMTREKAEVENIGAIGMYTDMEIPEATNPEVSFQPMLCQHCNHAPCETVCPVAATTHSNEGLNQMAYNRCIGTRYCANNCPYKVRRFNWFNYPTNDKFADVNPAMEELSRMVLNPDVIVRERGVMEKCTFCVQRIQMGKLDAKKEKRKVRDGEIVTACAAACPTKAINFGDYNDVMSNDGQGSLVKQIGDSSRAFHVIEEVGTKPNIFYLTKVRNKLAEEKA
nr:4Fe-4S dicluster domain-containing protein [Bacteroidota bacterium]